MSADVDQFTLSIFSIEGSGGCQKENGRHLIGYSLPIPLRLQLHDLKSTLLIGKFKQTFRQVQTNAKQDCLQRTLAMEELCKHGLSPTN